MSIIFRNRSRFGMGVVVGTVGAIALVVGMGTQGAQPPPPVVTANLFRLVDDQGKLRGSWTVDKDAAMFTMADMTGRTRASIIVKDSPEMRLWGENGEKSLTISQDQKNGTWIIMFDQDGTARLDAQVYRDSASVHLRGPDKKSRVSVRCPADDTPQIELLAKDGSVLWTSSKPPAGENK